MLGRRGTKRSILVVEDNEINRMMLCAVLEKDFDVIEAADGLEGLEKLSEHYQTLSLILLDVYMPRCDGFEFLRCKGAEERYDTLPVIITTAGGSVEDEIKCLELGANDSVVKPYNFDIILNRINNMIRLRESATMVNRLTWDEDTGLYSKEFFHRSVEDLFYRESQSEGFDLVVSEVENYALLNDRYGETHSVELLRELASVLHDRLSPGVIGGRIETSNFAFVLPHAERDWDELLTLGPDSLSLPNVSVKFGVVEK